jgi:hypothetical protein
LTSSAAVPTSWEVSAMRKLILSVVVPSVIVAFGVCASAQTRNSTAGQPASTAGQPTAATVPPQPRVNPTAEVMAAFRKRVDEYLKLRNEITKKIPEVKETGDPNKISAREKALGQAIAAARASAKPGDVFGRDATPLFMKILADDWRTRKPADRKAVFTELPKGTHININQPYPTTLPLLTVPGNLLASLPVLPDELEYRVVDRHLLLRDRDANLTIDVLFNALPRMEK